MATNVKELAGLARAHRDGLIRMIRAEYVAAGHSVPADPEATRSARLAEIPTDDEIVAALVAEFSKDKETV